MENPASAMEVGGSASKKRRKQRRKKKANKGKVAHLESEFREPGEPFSLSKEPPVVRKPKYVVHVWRPDDVEKGRENLPIVMMEQEIMEAIQESPIVIVCGETGCGKTTQVPQFLYEAGYGSAECPERAGIIGVTQPRRVAVLATARRVAHELSVNLGQEVGFQVRHDRKIGEKSCIKFMTDGILLRELQADFLLRKYSVVVLDEAHERSLNTDILIGMLSRIIPLRQKLYDQDSEVQSKLNVEDGQLCTRKTNDVMPLKLVIMSATLRVEDFTANPRMFPKPPPVLRVPARQFPVTVHFSRKTELLDYVGAAHKKVCAIHRKLPPGGILVFLTGQREVEDLCRSLRRTFRPRKSGSQTAPSQGDTNHSELDPHVDNENPGDRFGDVTMESIAAAVDGQESISNQKKNESRFPREEADFSGDEFVGGDSESEDESDLEMVDDVTNDEDALQKLRRSVYALSGNLVGGQVGSFSNAPKDEVPDSSDKADTNTQTPTTNPELEPETPKGPGPVHVLPLYALLPAAAQLRVFAGVPKGMRLIVVATNVAETSITIPGVRYVVDCGRAKEREIDRASGISKYEVQWISKASADQRAGRAGRTGPGHCYRLYSSAHFNDSFPQFALPEINKATIEGVVPVMKCMGIDKVANFPFPSPPDHAAVVEAEKCLKYLSALSQQTGLLTPIGQAMAIYPISPRHSRMLLAAIRGAQELDPKTEGSDASLALAYSIAVAAALSLEDPFLREASTAEDDDDSRAHKRPKVNTEELDFNKPDHAVNVEDDKQEEKAKRKMKRNKANAAHATFKNVTSDAISVANALRAYEQAEDQEGFCKFHFLHAKTMHEMSKLRKQIWDLVVSNYSDARSNLEAVNQEGHIWNENLLSACEDCWRARAEQKLNAKQEDVIRQAICAGWADKVARRLSVQERAAMPEMWHQKRVLAYRVCTSEEPVFLHPSSSVCKEAPEFVVYNELVNTSRTYMRGVSGVDSKWLVRQATALCIFSKPLVDPPPWYDSWRDEVMCWVTPSFGPHLWNLPLHGTPMKKGKHRTAVFASSLLQGKVLPSLGSLYPYLTNDPSIVLKPESQALKRVSELMYRLGSAVDTRGKLRNVWATDRYFLYSELLSWVQSKYQTKLKEMWEQLLKEAQLTGEELYGKRKS
ncbi:unnamed protein product [Calypogeia fissa]